MRYEPNYAGPGYPIDIGISSTYNSDENDFEGIRIFINFNKLLIDWCETNTPNYILTYQINFYSYTRKWIIYFETKEEQALFKLTYFNIKDIND